MEIILPNMQPSVPSSLLLFEQSLEAGSFCFEKNAISGWTMTSNGEA